MSNLIDHARQELAILGYNGDLPEDDPNRWMYDSVMGLVEVFANQGHSGMSAPYAIDLTMKLLQYENVTEVTNDPQWWVEVGEGMWQCKRNPKFFSENGGRTYYDVERKDIVVTAKQAPGPVNRRG